MASSENVSIASELLDRAAALVPSDEEGRLRRHLLVAAALREVLSREPIVVGGTAEEFWSADEYHETDLDVVTWSLTTNEKALLVTLGFEREGRHWVHVRSGVAVEFPESSLRGDESRVHREPTNPGFAPIISVEDLYLDRIRQSTIGADDPKLQTYQSALAIAASNYERIDWAYVDSAIRSEKEATPGKMKEIDRRIRRTVRRKLAAASVRSPRPRRPT